MEKAMSSVAGIGKSLKANIPRIGKRKPSLSGSIAAGRPTESEEEANIMISKIPHSPSMPGASTMNLKTSSASLESSSSAGYSHLTNYNNDTYRSDALAALQKMQTDSIPTSAEKYNKVELSALTKAIQLTQATVEADEPWKFQELLAELSLTEGKSAVRSDTSRALDTKVHETVGGGNGSGQTKSVFTFPKRVGNGDVR